MTFYHYINKVDMFMFPILRQGHYILLYIDFRNFRYEIIDNSTLQSNKQLKYGGCLNELLVMLVEFFACIDPARSTMCACLESKRMQMSWRDGKNKVDYGVYVMHHMESYVGQGVARWRCGLTKGNVAQLKKLMLRYMKELATSEFNLHKCRNISRAYQFVSSIPRAP
ncbi:PREDICTED: uncharacterized protein LOC109154777 isoform X2 [Ipomoea nil]|uniref:uncharacterized protein LOC109154777 isoform X2 n=1 Tax=Ipomoea nil TaxID=35883 RepID=UPI000900850C|nr:PREDICTED: uncharacterized protein LOC109154777 isoform X2 [Ipomoea nil]